MKKTKIILFYLLSIVYILVTPLVYFFPGPVKLIIFIIPLSIIALVSFFRLNLLLATKSALHTFLLWLVANVFFNSLYVLNYMINLGIVRQRYGWYTDMPGFEFFIIIPLLFVCNLITLILIFIARKRINEGNDPRAKNDKIWIIIAIILGLLSILVATSSFVL